MTYADLQPKAQRDYADLDEESKRYPLEIRDSVIRFKGTPLIQACADRVNLNELWIEGRRNHWKTADMMQFYRMMGYSLCGFMEIFGERMDREFL